MAQFTEHAASTANLHKEISHLRHELKTTAGGHPASSEQIRVGNYLLERLAQLGVTVRRSPILNVRHLNRHSIDTLRCSRRFQPR